MATDPMLSLTLQGPDPRAWGTQHGETFRGAIREMVQIRRRLLVEKAPGWDEAQVEGLCRMHLEALAGRWPAIDAELTGIAAGAGLEATDLVLLNAYTDLKDFSAADHPPREGGCSVMAARGVGISFAAQTWDMHASAEPYVMAMNVPEPDGGYTRVLTVAGCLGMSGLNSRGVSVMINNLQCAETNGRGLIWPGFVRLLLRQRPPVQTGLMPDTLPSSGHHYLLADPDQAISFETTGRRFEVLGRVSRTDRPGYLMHANHYLGGLRAHEITARLGPTTRARQRAMETFAAEHPIEGADGSAVDGELLRRAFLEGGTLCNTVCLARKGDPNAGATCGGILVDHLANQVSLFRGPYGDGNRLQWAIR